MAFLLISNDVLIARSCSNIDRQPILRYAHLARDTVKASAARIGDSIDSDLDAA